MKTQVMVCLGLLLPACSGDMGASDTNVGQGTGGASASSAIVAGGGSSASSTGNSSGGVAAAGTGNQSSSPNQFDPGMTAGCAPWPKSKMAPWVGFFFFGPDPGPCSETVTSSTGTQSKTVFTYDAAGKPTSISYDSGTVDTYVYAGELISQVLRAGSLYASYTYEPYSVHYDAVGLFNVEWQLDALGYPRKLIYSHQLSAGVAPTVETYQYQYQNCRLVARTQTVANATTMDDWHYQYDAAGHISTITAANQTTFQEDYSCW